MNIEYLKATGFPDNISAGVTMVNRDIFPPHGLSISGGLYEYHELQKQREALQNTLGADSIAFQKQVHGRAIAYVDEKYREGETDGLITDKPGIFLCVSLADCCGILIYDPVSKAIGAFHSGWRGSREGMPGYAVMAMSKRFNSRPANLIVYIGPCASQDKYEVGPEFKKYFPEFTRRDSEGKYYYDNKANIVFQLLMHDVKAEHINQSNICNISDERFHSYRRDGDLSGRMGAFIGITTA